MLIPQWAESVQTFNSENWNIIYPKNHNIPIKYKQNTFYLSKNERFEAIFAGDMDF